MTATVGQAANKNTGADSAAAAPIPVAAMPVASMYPQHGAPYYGLHAQDTAQPQSMAHSSTGMYPPPPHGNYMMSGMGGYLYSPAAYHHHMMAMHYGGQMPMMSYDGHLGRMHSAAAVAV